MRTLSKSPSVSARSTVICSTTETGANSVCLRQARIRGRKVELAVGDRDEIGGNISSDPLSFFLHLELASRYVFPARRWPREQACNGTASTTRPGGES